MELSIRSPYGHDLSKDVVGRNGRVWVDFIIPLCYQPDALAFFHCPQHPMGKIDALLVEGDDVPDGKEPGSAFYNSNGIAVLYQGMHALSRYPQRDRFSAAEFFQDQMIDYLLISQIFHAVLRHCSGATREGNSTSSLPPPVRITKAGQGFDLLLIDDSRFLVFFLLFFLLHARSSPLVF